MMWVYLPYSCSRWYSWIQQLPFQPEPWQKDGHLNLSLYTDSLFPCLFIHLFGNWVWGGGWLSQLGVNFHLGHGHVDFAGSSVVHMVGGVAALAGAVVLGPRIGKYGKDGTVNTIPGHNIPMALLGTFILAFGWFGFNPGSTLAGTDFRISIIAVNTMMAGTMGALAAMIIGYAKTGKFDPGMMANGLLAGLVAITAPSAFVNSIGSVIVGTIAGILVYYGYNFIDRKLKVDDPVGAIAVHGINGAWGVISVGIFADGSYGDGWNGVPGTVKGFYMETEVSSLPRLLEQLPVLFSYMLHVVLGLKFPIKLRPSVFRLKMKSADWISLKWVFMVM